MGVPLGLIVGAGTAMLNASSQNTREQRAMQNQQRLMDIQYANQRMLNQQGHELQMKMWNDTNYGAQMEHMKKAGLNPALMYGMSGGGGTTAGSQGGGSAGGGQAPAPQQLDIANMMRSAGELELLKAQKENIEADTRNKDAQAHYTGGAQTRATEAGIDKIIAETSNEMAKNKLIEVQTNIEKIEVMYRGEQLVSNIQKVNAEMVKLHSEGYISQQSAESIIRETKAKATGQEVLNELNLSRIRLTDTQENQIRNAIAQEWEKISLYDTEVNIKIAQTILNGIGTVGGLVQAGKLAEAMKKGKELTEKQKEIEWGKGFQEGVEQWKGK